MMDLAISVEKPNPSSFLDDFKKCIADFDVGNDEPEALTKQIDNNASLTWNGPTPIDSLNPEKSSNGVDITGRQVYSLSTKNETKLEQSASNEISNNNQDLGMGQAEVPAQVAKAETLGDKKFSVESETGAEVEETTRSLATLGDGTENVGGVTRYNIITGGILHSQQKPCPVKKDLVRRYTSTERLEAETTTVMVNNGGGSVAKDYACKVCLKGFDSRSSVRKHICRLATDGEKNGNTGVEPQEALDMTVQDVEMVDRSMEEKFDEDMSADTSCTDSNMFDMREGNGMNNVGVDLSLGSTLQPLPSERMYPTEQDINMLTEEASELKNQQGQLFMCPICSMTFTQASVLTRHYRSHSNERPHECKDCHKAFRRKCHLKRHWQRIHSGEKPFKCGICSKAFSDRDHQRQHETIHGPETYPCLKCRSVFPTDGYLAAHVSQHPDCKAAFAQNAESQAKRIRGTKGKTVPGSYRCGLCGDFFKKLRQIQTHQRVRHHDAFEKKYKCNICQKGFDLISDLTHHRNGHVLRGSKYDTEKDTKSSSALPQPAKRMGRPDGTEPGGENKAELMEMLQQLEKRIQQQERKVQQMEHRQEHIGDDMIDSPSEIDFPQDELGSRLRYMFEQKTELIALNDDNAQDFLNYGKNLTHIPSENGALDFSVQKKIKLEKSSTESLPYFQESSSSGGITHLDGSNPMELQSKAVLDLMFRNRHKCKECGLSFLLYSEFRDHRKRHERARAAFGIEGSDAPKQTSSHMICGNPDGDRNLCRDCCKGNAGGSHEVSPAVEVSDPNPKALGSNNGEVDEDGMNEAAVHTRSKSGIHKLRHIESPYVSVVKRQDSCPRCTYLQDELTQEREDRLTLQEEVEGLRDVLLQFASFASKYPSLDNQLLNLLQKNHSKLNRGQQPATEEVELPVELPNGMDENVESQ